MMEVLARGTVAILLQYINYPTNMLYVLNLYNIICQLYLNKICKLLLV